MLATSTAYYAPLLIAVVGSSGIIGALIALVKLRGDTDSQAVSQAQGAAEVMQDLIGILERERDYWRHRYENCYTKRRELEQRVRQLEEEATRHDHV